MTNPKHATHTQHSEIHLKVLSFSFIQQKTNKN